MFSSVGWVELAIIFVVALLVIGPERLPGLIKEVRAILLAVRNAVGEARQQLDGEFGEEIREFSKPLAELNNVRQMGARGFITKTLFDGDESYLNSLDETKNQFRDTVESVRQPSLRDALRGAGAGSATGATSNDVARNNGGVGMAQDVNTPADRGGVEVTQQANAGESRAQMNSGEGSPVQEAARHLAMEELAGRTEPVEGSGAASLAGSENETAGPKNNAGGAGSWDDVI